MQIQQLALEAELNAQGQQTVASQYESAAQNQLQKIMQVKAKQENQVQGLSQAKDEIVGLKTQLNAVGSQLTKPVETFSYRGNYNSETETWKLQRRWDQLMYELCEKLNALRQQAWQTNQRSLKNFGYGVRRY